MNLNKSFNMELTTIFHKIVPFSDLKIDRQELFLLMGYGNQAPEKPFMEQIDQMIDELSACCTPEYGYTMHPGKRLDSEHIQIDDTTLQSGKIIASSLREAAHFAVFLATAGKGFDAWYNKIKQDDDMVRTFFADSLGSVIAEATVTVMKDSIERDMAEWGLSVSNSYSPGYCDWLLAEQRKLFAFFPAHFCGVTLTESCLMIPIKSVSGIIGIGQNVKKRLYSCDVCTMTTCVKNRKKNHYGFPQA